jgi:hypothetical protein
LKLATLRESGVDPRRLIGALVHSCGWSDSVETLTPGDAIGRYAPETLSAEAWIVTPEWLNWLYRPS